MYAHLTKAYLTNRTTHDTCLFTNVVIVIYGIKEDDKGHSRLINNDLETKYVSN